LIIKVLPYSADSTNLLLHITIKHMYRHFWEEKMS
jgi:hypothetical protein